MKKTVLFFCILSSFSIDLYANNLWQDIDAQDPNRNASHDEYRQIRAEHKPLKALLGNAPTLSSGGEGIIIDLPLPDGSMVKLEVFESPVLAIDIARRFPAIKTYKAFGVDHPGISGRLDFTPNGFHALLRTPDGIIYINPESNYNALSDKNIYRSINRKTQTEVHPFICKTENHSQRIAAYSYADSTASRSAGERTFGSTLRTYRLALSATREYSLAVANGNLANTYAEMVTAINRINEIYERDVALRLELVSGTELISTDTDDFSDNNPDALLTQNQTWIDSKTGSDNYDVGHIFSTGGGGLATIAAACDIDGYRAQGVTGASNPTTDAFYIDYVAHELGHQFGATHTFNAGGNSSGACNTANRQTDTYTYSPGLETTYLAASAYEVGSGSTIMAYAGICAPQDLQEHSDAYFHARSIEQIREFVDGDIASTIDWADGSRCGVNSSTGDMAPTAEAGTNYTIPGNTPFLLSGAATDDDSSSSTFTYTWEQYDLGKATNSLTAMNTDQGVGPLIRSREGNNNPQRFIPALNAILANNLTANVGERLPSTDRTMTFRLTVRSGTHGVAQDNMTITVDKDAGPFTVTAPTNSSNYDGLNIRNVTWNVARTTVSPVNCALVDIYYSLDGGNSFPTLLLNDTANDGIAEIQFPNTTTTQGRFKVACNNNIFFAVSPDNLTVTAATHFLSISGTPVASEGDAGTTYFDFTVSLSPSSSSTVTVNYAITGTGTYAASASDFGGTLPKGTLTFSPGQTSKTLGIAVSGDTLAEYSETFAAKLISATNAAITTATATGTIINDDSNPTINISAANAIENEGNSGVQPFTFTATRLGTISGISSVDYVVTGAGLHPASADDFETATLPAGTINFAAEETTKTITININGDQSIEPDENFTITISNPSGGNIDNNSAEGTIINDDTKTYYKKSSGGGNNSLLLLMLLITILVYRQTQRIT